MFKELLRLLICCLIIIVVMLASRGFMALVYDPLDSVPTCRGHGYGGFGTVIMNDKTDILSLQCTQEKTKREKKN